MAREEEVSVKLKLDDEYSDGVKKAADNSEDLSKGLDNVAESSADANLQFIATLEAIDKVGGAVAKIRSGVEDLGIANEETVESLRKIEGVANLVTGSATVAIVGMEGWKRATDNQRFAMVGLAGAAATVAFAYTAVTTESEKQRKIFSALTGVTAGLTAAKFALAAAEAANWTAASGPLAPITAAAIVGGLVAVAAGLATYQAGVSGVAREGGPTAGEVGLQTGAGTFKEVEVVSSGSVRLDAGENARISASRPPAILREKRSGPAIGEMNVTIVGAFNPWDPSQNRNASRVLGENILITLAGDA